MENQENQKNQLENPEQIQPNQPVPPAPQMGAKKQVKMTDNIFIKGIIVIALILAMLLPTPFILNLIWERKESKEKVVKAEGDRLGGNQTLYGPFIKLPYSVLDSSKKARMDYVYISPKNLQVNGELNPMPKHRGLYDILLYKTDLDIQADFDPSVYSRLDAGIDYHWNNAEIIFCVSDGKGLEENMNFRINGTDIPAETGGSVDMGEVSTTDDNSYQAKFVEELKVPVSLEDKKQLKVTIPLSLKGMGTLNFLPVAKNTQIKINTPLKDLKFDGNASPTDTVKDKIRTLEWKVPARGTNQIWSSTYDYSKDKFGVEIIQPNNEYGKTNRVAKYSILFIGLTFVTFFFIEIINKLKIHPVQYVLVGLALSVFYLLLLSISEYIGFNYSYLISASATVLLICWFIMGIVKSTKIMSVVFAVLALLYSYIFVIIQLDELALLAGSIGLFIILALLMYFSRKIEWKTE